MRITIAFCCSTNNKIHNNNLMMITVCLSPSRDMTLWLCLHMSTFQGQICGFLRPIISYKLFPPQYTVNLEIDILFSAGATRSYPGAGVIPTTIPGYA